MGDTHFPEAIGNSLLDHLLEVPKKDWNSLFFELDKKGESASEALLPKQEADRHKDSKPSRALVDYLGSYENPVYGTATLSLEADKLAVQWANHKVVLEHHHFDTFELRSDRAFEHQLLTFRLGSPMAKWKA